MTSEMRQLLDVLDGLRAGVLKKVAGLSESDGRRSTVDSGTNLAGLVQHLTYVESLWFEEVVGGGKARGIRSMRVDPSVSLRSLRAGYRAARETSNRIVEAIGDPDAPVTRNRQTHNLRWVMLSVIGETSRHAGHAISSANRSTARPGGDAVLVSSTTSERPGPLTVCTLRERLLTWANVLAALLSVSRRFAATCVLDVF